VARTASSSERRHQLDPIRAAILPSALIFCAFALLYVLANAYDYFLHRGVPMPETRSLLEVLLRPNARESKDLLGTIGQAVPGVLGIAITVVAIIVELASNRYTSKVTELFFHERVNLVVFVIFVVASMYPLWVAASYGPDFVPETGYFISLLLASISILILIPYFVYLFTFLQPANIIDAIRKSVRRSIATEAQRSGDDRERLLLIKRKVSLSVEQIADMALNSINSRDRGLAMDAVMAARGVVFDYLEHKPKLPQSWFVILPEERAGNPDYVTLSNEGVEDLRTERVWVEHKVMKQLHLVFAEALNNLPDLNNLIALFLKDVAVEALKREDHAAHRLALRFFNTSLRSAFAQRDVRTAYNILHQYRAVVESMISANKWALIEPVFGYFKYYGLLFESGGLGFILETVAYDVYQLLRIAIDQNLPNVEALLGVFLEVDRQPETGSSDVHLRGVRKAQSMLAAYCLFKGRTELVRRIAADMQAEPRERLLSIRSEILAADRTFWEITDRGVNFDFLEPELRPYLDRFFGESLRIPSISPPQAIG
jgi:hypothetical protein